MIGGLAFFFYGLQAIRNSMQLLAEGRIKSALRRITQNRFLAVGFGIFITLMLQSSSATTVMLVSFASTQMLTLWQAFGVILGADIGTTFVAVLLSIKKISEYSLVLIAFGFTFQWLSKRKKTQHLGAVILGFGLVFFGLNLLVHSAEPLKQNELATQFFFYMANNPLASLVVATIFTALVHASAATVGIAISLAFTGLIDFQTAIPIVLGANLGTCVTALMATIGTGIDGKRIAIAHIFTKLVGVAIIFPFIPAIAKFINSTSAYVCSCFNLVVPNDAGKIAITHLLFNVFVALLFLPFIGWGVSIIKKIVPDPVNAPEPFGPKFLDEKVLDTPILAFAQTRREMIRASGYAYSLFEDCLKMFEKRSDVPDIIEDIQSRDDKIDILDKAIRFYLAKLSRELLSDELSREQYALLNITSNIEEIGDIVSNDMVSLAKKKFSNNLVFSEDGWRELRHFHAQVLENFDITISAMTTPHPEVIQKIIRQQQKVYDLEQEYKYSHISRLHDGKTETFYSSSIHLDLLGDLRRVNGQLTYIARVISEQT